ncbi:MAG: efflux transporter outer membrane subunit [Burkholderiaceae bacterium]|nr:efflux transporter outer membrane subunit [Burkholderiaceae bacterium]
MGALTSVVIALSGCTTPLVRDAALPAAPVPAAWSVASVPAMLSGAVPTPLATWWQRFDDPQLAALIAQALDANASVLGARAALSQARAQRAVPPAGRLPFAAGAAAAPRAPTGHAGTGNVFQAGLDASWEVDVFGGLRSAVEAAEADVRTAQAELADVQVSLAAEVALAYIDLRGQQSRLAIARDNLALQDETLQIARWRVQAGLATSVDVEQARAAREQTAAQIAALESAAGLAQHVLAVLTGQAPGALQAALADGRPVPRVGDELVLAIPAETLRQRPDVRAAEQRISAALARASQADAARYPGFRLGGSLGLSASTLGDLASGAAVVSALLGSITVPLFDGGALRAQVRVQEAALEQARLAYKDTVLFALKDVEDALVALRADRERLQRLQSAAEAAGNAALLAQQRYASGLIDFQVVLDTQRTLLGTQDSVASTIASVGTDHVRLYKALGGGWQPETTP